MTVNDPPELNHVEHDQLCRASRDAIYELNDRPGAVTKSLQFGDNLVAVVSVTLVEVPDVDTAPVPAEAACGGPWVPASHRGPQVTSAS